ncbi:MAG: UDP-2,3-diacylglucosamine diphosphatase [bacterium]
MADTHFHLRPDREETARVVQFLAFLEAACQVDHLILLGDIFDFWFDYPHFRLKGYEEILLALDRVKSAGVEIHFVGGNHDIWATRYLNERYGVAGDGLPQILQLGHRRILLNHGDGLLSHDWIYSSFRWLVRHRAGILFAKAWHPELLFAFSSWLSGTSRNVTREEADAILHKASRWLQAQPPGDWELLVIGHVHHPFIVEHEGRIMAALGGWLGRAEYGLYQDGEFSLHDFDRDPPPTRRNALVPSDPE